jgi:DNA repair protein RadD
MPKIIGLSATPARGDGRGLGNIFDRIIPAPQTADLIPLNHLVGTRVFAPHDPDLKGVQTKAGDYVESQLAERMDKAELVGDIVEHWLRLAGRQPTIAFCCNVAHSKHTCDQFRLAGVLAEHIDASTPAKERKAILEKLAKGEIEVVCNCGILTEGFDAPNVGCIIMARPTKSAVLFRQMIGRGLRTAPGKTHCLVLDHSGAVFRHGFAEDRVEWTLHEDRRAENPTHSARSARHETSLCTCPECSAVRMQGQPCTACGWRPQPKAKPVDVIDGALGLVNRDRTVQPENWTSADRQHFWAELIWIAREKGWSAKAPLAMYRERFRTWPDSRTPPQPATPSLATRRWVKSRTIAYARGRAAAQQRSAQA